MEETASTSGSCLSEEHDLSNLFPLPTRSIPSKLSLGSLLVSPRFEIPWATDFDSSYDLHVATSIQGNQLGLDIVDNLGLLSSSIRNTSQRRRLEHAYHPYRRHLAQDNAPVLTIDPKKLHIMPEQLSTAEDPFGNDEAVTQNTPLYVNVFHSRPEDEADECGPVAGRAGSSFHAWSSEPEDFEVLCEPGVDESASLLRAIALSRTGLEDAFWSAKKSTALPGQHSPLTPYSGEAVSIAIVCPDDFSSRLHPVGKEVTSSPVLGSLSVPNDRSNDSDWEQTASRKTPQEEASNVASSSTKMATPTSHQPAKGEKTFWCNTCRCGFSRAADKKRHIESFHRVQEVPCDTCGGTFSRRDALNRHLKKGCTGKSRKRRLRTWEVSRGSGT